MSILLYVGCGLVCYIAGAALFFYSAIRFDLIDDECALFFGTMFWPVGSVIAPLVKVFGILGKFAVKRRNKVRVYRGY